MSQINELDGKPMGEPAAEPQGALGARVKSEPTAEAEWMHVHPEEAKRTAYSEAGEAFHWRTGWSFTPRYDIGGVLVSNTHEPGLWLLIPAREWQSIAEWVAQPPRRLFINPGEDPAAYDACVDAHRALNDLLLSIEAGKISREQVRAALNETLP